MSAAGRSTRVNCRARELPKVCLQEFTASKVAKVACEQLRPSSNATCQSGIKPCPALKRDRLRRTSEQSPPSGKITIIAPSNCDYLKTFQAVLLLQTHPPAMSTVPNLERDAMSDPQPYPPEGAPEGEPGWEQEETGTGPHTI